MKNLVIVAALCLLVVGDFKGMHAAQAQKPSPAANASCDLGGGKTLTVDYSSPRMKGRKIFGEIQIRPTRLVEVRRHDGADGLGLYATVGLAIRAGFCPPVARP